MERRLAELHLIQARERALRLICTGSTIIPVEWAPQLNELTIVDLAEFAVHARRLNELCDLRKEKFSGADYSRYSILDPGTEGVERDYHEALNRLIHAKSYVVGHSVWNGEKVFSGSQTNLIITSVKIETDRKAASYVSIVGIASCFCTAVLPLIKERFPELRF